MLSGAIASCIARTASKSSGQASRISTVVPSARSAYTRPLSCAVFIGVSLAENRAGDLGPEAHLPGAGSEPVVAGHRQAGQPGRGRPYITVGRGQDLAGGERPPSAELDLA